MEKMYLLYDSRYLNDPDEAIIFECCDTLYEAKGNMSDYGNDTVIVQVDINGKELINHKVIQ